MKKSYISPLVSEIEVSVELGFCQSPAGANFALGDLRDREKGRKTISL